VSEIYRKEIPQLTPVIGTSTHAISTDRIACLAPELLFPADYPEVLFVDSPESPRPARIWVARVFTGVEDVIYVGLGILLAGSSFTLLVSGLISFVQNLMAGSLATNIVSLLDRILLILLVVELLYTVQVSFRERTLVPEPFLLVGLIAVIRRVLVLTAELAQVHDIPDDVFRRFIMELGVLTLMIVALVVSLVLLRQRRGIVAAERAT
jgi:uncharacterized membrane protein (DUF373 family)